jgi:lysozyme
MTTRAFGIDVSGNNGPFNWSPWKDHIQFAAAKATEGRNFTDPEFASNWQGMETIGVYRFAYHYGVPDNDPSGQASRFLETIESHGLKKDDNFFLDLEDTGGLDPVDVSFWAWTFCHEVNRLKPGHRTVVFTYPSFADEGNCARLGGHPLWIANYDVPTPEVPLPWRAWQFWQYSGQTLDRDVFNGDAAELAKFCGNG